MPRHNGSSFERTRKHRKRRARNGQSWRDKQGNQAAQPLTRKQKQREYDRLFRKLARKRGWYIDRSQD